MTREARSDRLQDRGPLPSQTSEMGSLPDTQVGRYEGHEQPAAYTELEAPLYPHRDWVEAGKCGWQPVKDLEAWVKGGTFHRYGVKAFDRGPTVEEALARMRDYPAVLEFGSEFDGSYVMFSVKARQAGDPESWLSSRPHFTPEDASYAALSMIEEHDREVYEQVVPLGLA